jgi:hypothetical protein
LRRDLLGIRLEPLNDSREVFPMFIGVIHRINDADAAFSRGERMIQDAPAGLTGREFYPAKDLTTATCLWEAESVDALREYIDSTLGDSSENTYFEIKTEMAAGLPKEEAARA